MWPESENAQADIDKNAKSLKLGEFERDPLCIGPQHWPCCCVIELMNDGELGGPKLGFNARAHREKSSFISAIIAMLVHYEHMGFVSLGHMKSLLPTKVL
jgi:hypothetical protein